MQHNSIVVLNNGAPVVMSEWIDGTAAVLEAWMMGQAGGGAIADVLYGKVNPSGKLAETFPLKLTDTPAYINFPGGNGVVRYGEGIFMGYRYYDARQAAVLFPFGYGMSYTSFEYKNPKISAKSFRDVDGVNVSVDITNTGKMAGKEVVQVYVHDQQSGLVRPPKELKGFAKVELQPGDTKTVTIALDFRAFAYYHPGYRLWITEDGQFDILIGASSTDIRGSLTVSLQSTLKLPSLLNRDSSLGEWLKDPRGKRVLEPLTQQMAKQMQAAASGGRDVDPEVMADMMNYLKELPLHDIFNFVDTDLSMSPDEVVEGMLAEVKQMK